jgi:DNA-binding LytR/AlgR family response regulator
MIRIVIIEDEKLIAAELCKKLNALPFDLHIMAILDSVDACKLYFSSHPEIDLVFSDIQLPDGLSFDIFCKTDCSFPVVFITAYDKYMVNAFEYNGIDYLLKPADENDLLKVLNKYKTLEKHFNQRSRFFDAFTRRKTRLLVRKGLVTVPLRLEDIVLFYTENKVVYVVDNAHAKYICDKTLTELEDELDHSSFFRANRQYIINAAYIRGFRAYEKVKLRLDLSLPEFQQPIVISQEMAPSFREWIKTR